MRRLRHPHHVCLGRDGAVGANSMFAVAKSLPNGV
jgi:hypothetical protein